MYCLEDDDKTITQFYTLNPLIKQDKIYLIDLLKIIRDENVKMKKVLELKYYYLSQYYDIIQCLVILFSTFSAFIQGIEKMTNITKLNPNVVQVVTLIISTIISLLLSIAKFFKISEKKESLSNLLENISQFNNKVVANIKKIKYWKVNIKTTEENHPTDEIYEITQWNEFSNKIKEEIDNFFEDKLEIMNGYESLINTYERTKYDIQNIEIKNKFTIKEHKINKRFDKDLYNIKTNNYFIKRLFKKMCLCFIHLYNCICCLYCKDIHIDDEDKEITMHIDQNFNKEKENISKRKLFKKNEFEKKNIDEFISDEDLTNEEV